MNDARNDESGGLRRLLSTQVSGEETMTHRDVIDDAMAWGDKHRRRDRVLAVTGAALAVAMVGAGTVALGSSGVSSSGAANGPATPGTLTPGASGTERCMVPEFGYLVDNAQLCASEDHLHKASYQFADDAVPLINKHLPSGVRAAAVPGTVNITLTGSQGTNGMTLDLESKGFVPQCAPTRSIYQCSAVDILGGSATVDSVKEGDSVTSSLFWHSPGDYSIMMQSWNKPPAMSQTAFPSSMPVGNATGTPNSDVTPPANLPPTTPSAGLSYLMLPTVAPTQKPQATAQAMYLTTDAMVAIVKDPNLQALALRYIAEYAELHSQILALEAKLGYGPTPNGSSSSTLWNPPPSDTNAPIPTSTGPGEPWLTSPASPASSATPPVTPGTSHS